MAEGGEETMTGIEPPSSDPDVDAIYREFRDATGKPPHDLRPRRVPRWFWPLVMIACVPGVLAWWALIAWLR